MQTDTNTIVGLQVAGIGFELKGDLSNIPKILKGVFGFARKATHSTARTIASRTAPKE